MTCVKSLGAPSDTLRMTLILLIVVGPWILSRVIHHWVDWKHMSAPKHHEESDIERKLNDMQADLRFESTWNLSSAEEGQSRKNPRWQTPEEMLLEDKLKRTDKDWTPRLSGLPGVVHQDQTPHKR